MLFNTQPRALRPASDPTLQSNVDGTFHIFFVTLYAIHLYYISTAHFYGYLFNPYLNFTSPLLTILDIILSLPPAFT